MEEASASVSSEAVAALTALLRGLLPEAWRGDVTVTRYPGGFTLRCIDADGREHAFEVQRRQPGAEAFVTGAALAFNYTLPDAGPDAPARVTAYQDVLAALAAREADLAAALDAADAADAPRPAPPPGGPDVPPRGVTHPEAAEAFPNEIAAAPELAALLTDALPEAWRNNVVATLTPGGFTLRLRDGEGHEHVLDARPRRPDDGALVSGPALSYGYTLVDPALDDADAALKAAYQGVLEAFAAREAAIIPWLTAEAAPENEGLATGTFEPFPNERPAPAGLVELLTAALPEAWRARTSVALTEEGFVLRFEDADGRKHILEARRGDESPSLVKGMALGFSYRAVEDASDEVALVAAYRDAAKAFLGREDELLAWLTWEPAPENEGLATGTFEPFPNERPAPAGLVELLTAALPEAWRLDVSVALSDEGFVLRFEDADGRKHILEARRGDESPSLVKGMALGFSYRAVEDASDEVALVAAYRDAAKAFLGREDELLAWLAAEPAPENEGLATGTFDVLPDEHPAPDALTALLRDALPEAWRHNVSAALVAKGLVLRFEDADGHKHILEARRGDGPALVRGSEIGFSYRAVEDERDEVTLVATYRAAMTALLARERDIAPWLDDATEDAPVDEGDPAIRSVHAFIVRLLPAALRRDVEVFTRPDGLVIRCLDEGGLTHRIELHALTPDAAPPVRGAVYGYAYAPDPARPDAPLDAPSRAVLQHLADNEGLILSVLARTTEEPRWREPYPDAAASPPDLASQVAALLPASARGDAQVQKLPDGFAVRFRDPRGMAHMLEGRVVSAGYPSLVRGPTLGFSYMKVDPGLDEVAAVRWYREVLQPFVAADAALAAALAAT